MSDLDRKLEAAWSSAIKLKSGVTDVTTVTAGVPEAPERYARRNRNAVEPSGYVSEPARYVSYVGYATKRAGVSDLGDFEERAAIAENCGGLSQAQAEVLAALHVADLGVERERVIDAAARVLD